MATVSTYLNFPRNMIASAKLLALDVPWAESGAGPFAPVYVNDGLTLDFQDSVA